MKFQSLALFLLVLLVSIARNQAKSIYTGYSPIRFINDPYVTEMAHFAINEHNKQAGEKLEFKKVIKGEEQYLAWINYRLTISASNGSISRNYVAVVYVYETPSYHVRKLTSFEPVHA